MSGEEQNDSQEKSFEPTQRRLDQAREQGDVAKSPDVAAAAAYVGFALALLAVGASAAASAGKALTPFLGSVDQLEGRILGPGGLALSAALTGGTMLAVAPLFLAPAVLVLAVLLAQQAIVAAPEKLMPKLNRISPMATAAQKFGPSGLMEFAKSAVKLAAISAAMWFWLASEIEDIILLAATPARGLGAALGAALRSLLGWIVAIAVAIAAVDFLWQRYDHARKLRMSLEEMRREAKETEGDPHTRGARRRRAEEIATSRMMLDVPRADVVIVNPTHYAVALKWTRAKGSAPIVVAKGVDEVAARIRAAAAGAGVPIHRDPPTARALHATTQIGREIAPEHYRAVAAAIRFADDIRRKARARR
jgi:flagellar biosynthetic protein FlhB